MAAADKTTCLLVQLKNLVPNQQNLMEIVHPGGSILWGSFVQGDRKWGIVSPGIKWVPDQMRRSYSSLFTYSMDNLHSFFCSKDNSENTL